MKLTPDILHCVMEPAGFDRPLANIRLANKMIKLMKKQHGIGLAANQVGIGRRMFVMRFQNNDIACWNPEIISVSDAQSNFDEGCLSYPDQTCEITRPAEINVLYYNCVGKEFQTHMTGIESRCFQHELDHLNGITMWDRYKEQNVKQPGN